MEKRVLFLSPPKMFSYNRFAKSIVSSSTVSSSVPYGVLSIATYIKHYSSNEVISKILDFSVLPSSPREIEEEVQKTVRQFKPDIVGVSTLFSLVYDSIKYFCDMVKEVDASVITVAGGACAMNDYPELLKNTNTLDAICYSEGEKPLLRLVDAEDPYQVLNNDVAWITRKSLADGKTPTPDFIYSLDDIPFLDYDLIDYQKFQPSIDFNAFSDNKNDASDSVYLSIHTTRGCPYNCIFCAVNKLHGKKMRYMSSKYTLDNIKFMVEKYGLTHLTFEDDQFLIDKKRAKEILQGIYALETKVEVCISAVTVSFVDEEIAALMKQIGIDKLNLAVEHGSEYVLREIIEKPFTMKQLDRAVKALKKYDISPSFLIVTGLPGEREEDRDETVRLIKELGIDWTIFHTATPFKGSRLYDICIENGYIKEEDINSTDMKHAVINLPDMKVEYITEKTYLMNLELNFVCNYRMKIGDYKTALIWFNEVARKYPEHAFVHYYISKAYEGLKETNKAEKHFKRFEEVVDSSENWRKYARYFSLI